MTPQLIEDGIGITADKASEFERERSLDWDPLPLFPWLPATEPVYRSAIDVPFADPFLMKILMSTPVQRLRGIGFLGALDHVLYSNGDDPYRRRHNRYDHSVGVAKLADRFASARMLSTKEKRVFIAAALLHDVGHGPLSHTLEPVFKTRFGITHHSAGRDIIMGRSPLGNEITAIAGSYGISVDEILAMIDGQHDAPHAYLFSSPINLDTIEGITRTSLFAAAQQTNIRSEKLIDLIASQSDLPTEAMDAFWSLKNRVYNLFIHTSSGLVFDGLAQAYMSREIDSFSPRDFLKTEFQLRHKQPVLFQLFAWARASRNRVQIRVSRLFADLLDYPLETPVRTFFVSEDVALRSSDDLNLRYLQSKTPRRQTIGSIFAALDSKDFKK